MFRYQMMWVSIVSLLCLGCNDLPPEVELSISKAGKNGIELKKVIDYYSQTGQRQKLKAAYYLIAGLPYQYHYKGSLIDNYRNQFVKMDSLGRHGYNNSIKATWDSLERTMDKVDQVNMWKVNDIDIITSDYLINNIEEAFEAWSLPWARELSFDQFCEYILPYKIINEAPGYWRRYFRKKYQWAIDSLKGRCNALELTKIVNSDLEKWFHFNTKFKAPFDLSFQDLLNLKSGACIHQVTISTYAMRALGLPIAVEGVPFWANRTSRHDWNVLAVGDGFPFQGADVNPGSYKIEAMRIGISKSKLPKIYRRTYAAQKNSLSFFGLKDQEIPEGLKDTRYVDVTTSYIPVGNPIVKTTLAPEDAKIIYLCVFNRNNWKPVDWAFSKRGEAQFENVGKGIVYLPMYFEEGRLYPAGDVFILGDNNKSTILIPHYAKRFTKQFYKRSPNNGYANATDVIKGNSYELLYWDREWRTLGIQEADTNYVIFDNLPANSLLRLRNIDRRYAERIFTCDTSIVSWW